jgi:hypothetical protein
MQAYNVFIVEYNGQIIGVWDSYESAKTFILGCQQNSLMTQSANIKTYQINTCFCVNTNTINQENKIKTPEKMSDKIPEKLFEKMPNKIPDKIPEKIKKTCWFDDDSDQLEKKSNQNKDDIENIDKKSYMLEEELYKFRVKPKIDTKNPAYLEMTKQKVELQHKINMLTQQKKKIEESKNTYSNDYKLFELFSDSRKKDPKFIIPEIFTKKFDLFTKLKNENNLSWENFVKEFQHENIYNEYFGLNNYEEMFLESEPNGDISDELDIESDSDTDISDNDK